MYASLKPVFLFALVATLFASCAKDEDPVVCTTDADLGPGVWITNEGGFGNNNASLTFLADDGTVRDGIFEEVNGQPLGDVAQSIFTHNGLGYIAVNGSQKIEIIDLSSGERLHTLTGFDYPRYFTADTDGTVYVSNGSGAGEVSAIDGAAGQIEWTSQVGSGPERMATNDQYLVVCNSGGFGTDNTVSVFDLSNDVLVETITVGDRPVDIEVDGNGDFWVLAKGETLYNDSWEVTGHTDARLVEISGSDLSILHNHQAGEEGDHPTHLAQTPSGLLVLALNGLQSIAPTTGSLTSLVEGSFYSLDVDPSTGYIWAAPYPDFQNPSAINVYDTSGALMTTHDAGIAPNTAAFVSE